MLAFWEFLAGIVATVLLGGVVGCLLDSVIPEPRRNKALSKALWRAMMYRAHVGKWIGFFERMLSLMSFWIGQSAYVILGGWLAFKVATKWEVWKNIIQAPLTLEGTRQPVWYQIRTEYGSWLYSRFLLGTLLNVLIGAVGAYLGHHSSEIAEWLFQIGKLEER